MPEFFFFRKGRQLVAADRKDSAAAERLKADGYQKQFEEIIAPDAERALIRLQQRRLPTGSSSKKPPREAVFYCRSDAQ